MDKGTLVLFMQLKTKRLQRNMSDLFYSKFSFLSSSLLLSWWYQRASFARAFDFEDFAVALQLKCEIKANLHPKNLVLQAPKPTVTHVNDKNLFFSFINWTWNWSLEAPNEKRHIIQLIRPWDNFQSVLIYLKNIFKVWSTVCIVLDGAYVSN